MSNDIDREKAERRRKLIGNVLLIIVNVLWVLSAEATEVSKLVNYIFLDEKFKRPFFTVYVKSVLCTVYLLRFCFCATPTQTTNPYSRLEISSATEDEHEISLQMDEIVDPLSDEGFEPIMTNSESEDEERRQRRTSLSSLPNLSDPPNNSRKDSDVQRRRVRFAPAKEIKRLPASEAFEAKLARMSHDAAVQMLVCDWQPQTLYSVFFLAPIWLCSSFTYQASLLYTSVATLNLISSSSSIFLLLLSICFPSNHARFTLFKALLVGINLSGVLIVSEFATTMTGAVLSQVSAFLYASYLVSYSRIEYKIGKLDVTFIFGSVGLVSIFIGTPLLWFLNATGVEPFYPLPTQQQFWSIVAAAILGTLLADYLWLTAASLTDSLAVSLSLSLSIPLSFVADILLRNQPPSFVQCLAAIPIVFSFIASGFIDNPRKAVSQGRSKLTPSKLANAVGRRKGLEEDHEQLLPDDSPTDNV
ncbi:hypothetical protein WR25_13399 [Diploscapter pachys]|uniref:Solute carrier family 35 member F5 n=1 Tax=Diploscapter pachys TaxID=2018661 RepID=A0A2A2J3G8_9BILA|nr:hypothetical protein WR25_13399 [Diploscapter pachys]